MSETNTTACPKCGKDNPVGAKFCSGCAVSLAADQPSPTPSPGPTPGPTPPPPPPSRPGLGGMLGQTGGKVEQRQVAGDPAALYTATEKFISNREGSTIKSQFPTQQITAGIVFKDFLATMNAPVKVDTEINIAPAGAGQCTVTVGGKADYGSASKLWIFSFVIFLVGFMMISMLMFLILGIGGTVFQMYLLNSRGPRIVAEDLFEYLNQHGASTTPAAPAAAQAPPTPSPTPAPTTPATAPTEVPQTSGDNGTSEPSLADRIRKLDTLKEEGLISEEEYDARRDEILKEI